MFVPNLNNNDMSTTMRLPRKPMFYLLNGLRILSITALVVGIIAAFCYIIKQFEGKVFNFFIFSNLFFLIFASSTFIVIEAGLFKNYFLKYWPSFGCTSTFIALGCGEIVLGFQILAVITEADYSSKTLGRAVYGLCLASGILLTSIGFIYVALSVWAQRYYKDYFLKAVRSLAIVKMQSSLQPNLDIPGHRDEEHALQTLPYHAARAPPAFTPSQNPYLLDEHLANAPSMTFETPQRQIKYRNSESFFQVGLDTSTNRSSTIQTNTQTSHSPQQPQSPRATLQRSTSRASTGYVPSYYTTLSDVAHPFENFDEQLLAPPVPPLPARSSNRSHTRRLSIISLPWSYHRNSKGYSKG